MSCAAGLLLIASMTTGVFGCSIPDGGYKEPTPAELISYANHVVIGEVTSRGSDPAFYDSYGTTYGVNVTIQCAYKGGPLPGGVVIGGAGFIPGRCLVMDLEVGQRYVIFLEKIRKSERYEYYQQNSPAYPVANISAFLSLCDLKVAYPQADNGITIKRKECPPIAKSSTCVRFTADGVVTVPRQETPIQKQASTVKGLDVKSPTSSPGQVGQSRDNDGNGGVTSTTSCLLIGAALVAIVLL